MIDLALFENWIQQHLFTCARLDEPMLLTQINSDAGYRLYYRINSQPTLIAVLSPPSSENNISFVRLSQCFKKHHIRAPIVHAVDYTSGFLLLEDLYETIEKHQELLDKNIHNQVMLTHVESQLDKALEDIEKLKDKVRENGKNY